MKALSLLQPWASLVVLGLKTVETRAWTTAYRGPLLIHAGKSRAGRDFAALAHIGKHLPAFDELPFGAVIGSVQLVDAVRLTHGRLADPALAAGMLEYGAFGADVPGRWGFLFEEAVSFDEPLACSGRLGVFDV